MAETPVAEEEATEDLSKLERRFLEKVRDLERRCMEAESEYLFARSEAKRAKKDLDVCVQELRNVIKRGPSEQQELDFEDSENEEDEDDWKTVPITDALKLTEKQIEKLFSVGVETVGDFEILRAGTKDHPRGLIDVKGVGASTIDRWEEELLDWFDKRRVAKSKKEAQDLDEDAEDDDEFDDE